MVSRFNSLRDEGATPATPLCEGALSGCARADDSPGGEPGFAPMAAHGTGAGYSPLATVVIGGLISSTLPHALVLPAFTAAERDGVAGDLRRHARLSPVLPPFAPCRAREAAQDRKIHRRSFPLEVGDAVEHVCAGTASPGREREGVVQLASVADNVAAVPTYIPFRRVGRDLFQMAIACEDVAAAAPKPLMPGNPSAESPTRAR